MAQPGASESPEGVVEGGMVRCVPILCCLQGSEKCVPTVKVTSAAGQTCVFPLSLEELGQVWEGGEVMWPWVEQRTETDWERARTLFSRLVEFPADAMRSLLDVLKSGRYVGEERVTNKNWKDSISSKPERFDFKTHCSRCDSLLPMCFADFSRKECIKEPLLCVNFGLSCVTKIPTSSAPAESDGNDGNGNVGEREEAIPTGERRRVDGNPPIEYADLV